MTAAVTICPFHFGVGYHRAYVVDFQINSVIGEPSVPLCVLNKRRLTSPFPTLVKRHLKRDEAQLQLHKFLLKIQQLKYQWHTLNPSRREIKLNSIYELTTDQLMNA